jgi:RTX calcium-binding nonapeptide repeat (4 copies)
MTVTIVSTPGHVGVTMIGGDQLIVTSSGSIAHAGFLGGVLVDGAGSDTILISGEVLSVDVGIYTNLGNPNISITRTGSLYSNSYAIFMNTGTKLSLFNSGHIESFQSYAIYGNNLEDNVVNSGFISGDVYLLQGNDTFNNRGGALKGAVDLGSGDDALLLDAIPLSGPLTARGGSGFDTINLSSAASAVWMDLQYSQMEVWTSGTGIANGATANTMVANIDSFEKIIGTVGSDVILGDAQNNTYIYNGNFSGTADVFFGRGGLDTIDLSSLKSIWVDLNLSANEVFTSGTNLAYGYNSNIVVANIDSVERIIGTTGSDQVYGDAADNIFSSNGVGVTFTAEFDLDRFDGRGGSDTFDLSTMPSSVFGFNPAWVDLTYNGPEVWIVVGPTFANGVNANIAIADLTSVENFIGTRNSDQFFGDANANTYGFNGFDGTHTEIFDGRGGIDTFDGSLSNIALWIGLSNIGMEVWTNGSTTVGATGANANTAVADLVSVDNITGSLYGDTLIGDGAANRIEGGKGNDVLLGGLGADTFVFNFDSVKSVGFDNDTINDFAFGSGAGHDVIQLSGFGSFNDSFAEVILGATNTVAGVHIEFQVYDGVAYNISSIDLLGLVKAQLTADDFVFV